MGNIKSQKDKDPQLGNIFLSRQFVKSDKCSHFGETMQQGLEKKLEMFRYGCLQAHRQSDFK